MCISTTTKKKNAQTPQSLSLLECSSEFSSLSDKTWEDSLLEKLSISRENMVTYQHLEDLPSKSMIS